MSGVEAEAGASGLRGPVAPVDGPGPEPGPDALDARYRRAADWIREAERVWLGTHLDPDGDAIGSSLGLAHALRERGIEVSVACQDAPPRETRFLPGVEGIGAFTPGSAPLAIALDTGDERRLGSLFDAEAWSRRRSVLLDHHASNPGFCDIDIIDPRAASTAEIVVRLLDALDFELSPSVATCLLTGIITDTIGFRTSNTTSSTLACAVKLMEAGASLTAIVQEVFFRQPLAGLKLGALAVDRLQVDADVGLTWILQEDFDRVGASADDTREISRSLATVAEMQVVAILREREDGRFDLSLRARPGVDLIPVAQALGGGGHPQAAGARLDGPLAHARGRVREALQRVAGTPRESERKR